MNHRVARACLYGVLFLCFCLLTALRDVSRWALAEYGLWTMLAGIGAYATVGVGSAWLLNKLNEPFVNPTKSDDTSAFADPVTPDIMPPAFSRQAPDLEPEIQFIQVAPDQVLVRSQTDKVATREVGTASTSRQS